MSDKSTFFGESGAHTFREPAAASLSNFRRNANWLDACGKQPSEASLSVQIGCCLEEMAEFVDTLNILSPTGSTSAAGQENSAFMKAIGNNLKSGYAIARIYDREMALDALCDIEVTLNGIAYLAGMDKEEADRRVLASNESKLNLDGTPVILPGGKIGKGPQYVAPNLTGLF